MEEWILFDIVMLICVLTFAGIGIWALCRKTPMHFYSGTTVAPEKIINIKKYNRANAIMWFCYCVPLAWAMAVAPYSMDKAEIIAGVGVVGGIPFLIFTYEIIIKRRYFK